MSHWNYQAALDEMVAERGGQLIPSMQLAAEMDPELMAHIYQVMKITRLEASESQRPGTLLGPKYRDLINISLLASLYLNAPLKLHIRRALSHGAVPEEVFEALQLCVITVGAPAFLAGVGALAEVLSEQGYNQPNRENPSCVGRGVHTAVHPKKTARKPVPIETINHGQIHYELRGSGIPVLFIHGGFGGPETTLVPSAQPPIEVMFPLDRFQTITYDRRGAGQSQYWNEWYTVQDLADDAEALRALCNADRLIVVGDSMGGMVALAYALKFPKRVAGLALVETGANLIAETTFGQDGAALLADIQRRGERQVFNERREVVRATGDHRPNPSPTAVATAGTAEMRARREAMTAALAVVDDETLYRLWGGAMRNYYAFTGFDFSDRLGELTMPVCIVHGEQDVSVPFALGVAMHRAIPHSELHAIPGGTHRLLAFAEATDALRTWALAFADPVAAR